MIKHVIFTDESLAKVFCYDLAGTLTPKEIQGGKQIYSVALPHPTKPSAFSVMVEDDVPEVMAIVNAYNYVPEILDTSWFSVENPPVVILT